MSETTYELILTNLEMLYRPYMRRTIPERNLEPRNQYEHYIQNVEYRVLHCWDVSLDEIRRAVKEALE